MLTYFGSEAGAWTWIILGIVLVGLELVVPGVFMIWLGLAALATGGLVFLFGLGWQTALIAYGGLALAAVIGARWLNGRQMAGEQDADLNRADRALIGRVLTLESAIVKGQGRVRVDDSSWRVVGPDLPVGARVKVIRVEGTSLVVEKA
ncbi:MAG: NfeD family protein [Salinarimonadaceae bacterium]|nr:MAG: NfeD family protein [Salinarimonadaceae bacterium]